MIPYADIAPLMRASVALLNPSTFEGWSTTVEEAKASGVPMLLSDLDVHREQAGEGAEYFDRFSAESLANALAKFHPLDAEGRFARGVAARQDAQARVTRFAREFVSVAQKAASKPLML
jgi:glycosyltransferase involved in cell wall biosynthesis